MTIFQIKSSLQKNVEDMRFARWLGDMLTGEYYQKKCNLVYILVRCYILLKNEKKETFFLIIIIIEIVAAR